MAASGVRDAPVIEVAFAPLPVVARAAEPAIPGKDTGRAVPKFHSKGTGAMRGA